MKIKVIKDFPIWLNKKELITIKAGAYLEQNGDEFNFKNCSDKLTIEHILNAKDWFEVIYEVGDYVKRIGKDYINMKVGEIYQVTGIDSNNDSPMLNNNNFGCSKENFIPASPSEIKAYQDRDGLPYEYKPASDIYIVNQSEYLKDVVEIERKTNNEWVYLDKKSLIEIAKRAFGLRVME